MKKVIVFGSLNIDLSIRCPAVPAKGETIEGSDFLRTPGGKGGNQAVASARLGAETHMLGCLGNDLFGEEVYHSLTAAGVCCDNLLRNGKSTGVAVILRCEEDNRIICDYGANHAITADEVLPLLGALASPGDIFLTQLECRAEETFKLLYAAKEIGMVTILNPAPAQILPMPLYAALDYLIANQTECHILTGMLPNRREDCQDALQLLQERGVAVPLITLGKEGSTCYMGKQFYGVPSFRVQNVDTTAAGDAFIGAFACALARDTELSEAMVFATRAAAMTITRLGAQQSIPTLDELEQFEIGSVR